MTGNLAGFDATQVQEMDYTPIPEGRYVMIATSTEKKPTKDGDGEYLQVVLEIIDGPAKGRKHWVRLNLKNQNPSAVDMARRELASICKAVGVLRPVSSSELENKPMIVTIGIKKNKTNGKDENVCNKYESPNGAAPVEAAASYTPPAAQAQAAPATAAPPWAK